MAHAIKIKTRQRNPEVLAAALKAGYTPLQATILASRMSDTLPDALRRKVSPFRDDLTSPWLLPDIEPAVERLSKAVIDQEDILVCSDHDVDGISGGTIIREVLLDYFHHPLEKTFSYCSHKQKEGYGISETFVQRLLSEGHRDGLLVTVDQGSSDEPRIAALAKQGIQTIVTDHHHLPEHDGPPASAYATVNPIREDSNFGDRNIAGGYVAWLVARATRDRLIEMGHLPQNTSDLTELFDMAAVATVGDVIDLASSHNSRRVVQEGLHLINTKQRPCWIALSERMNHSGPWDAQTIGFGAGPRLNCSGRVGDAMPGLKLLRAPTIDVARHYADILEGNNAERKEIEKQMRDRVMRIAEDDVAAGRSGLAVYDPQGHSGVGGICASRIVERYGRPTIVFSPQTNSPGILSGSARSIPGFHVRHALDAIRAINPRALISYGGHFGAAGLRLHSDQLETFQQLWDEQVILSGLVTGPVLMTDGPLGAEPNLSMLTEIGALGPYGRMFELPVFEERLQVLACKPVGDGTHMKLQLKLRDKMIDAIWFSARNSSDEKLPVQVGAHYQFAFSLDANTFRNQTTLQFQIKAVN